MPKVFISHSSKDKPFVRKLKEDLKFNEIETWVDEDEMGPGDKLYDSLILGLNSSSHFIIVLSNNIKNSNWVETEINEAIAALNKNILKKIIPIILRKTEIPEVFKNLIYSDFSSITFTLTSEDKVNFTGNKYTEEIDKIIRAIKESKDYNLTPNDIKTIVTTTSSASSPSRVMKRVVCLYEIVGFNTQESRRSFILSMQVKYPNSPLAKMNLNVIIPITLPSLLKSLFTNLQLGDKLFFPLGKGTMKFGHFCGYTTNNTRILLGGELIKFFQIHKDEILSIGIDGLNRHLFLYDE